MNKAFNAAQQVINVLHGRGYEAYLVGGCVRDILLQRDSKDYDVTTNALPEQVQDLFEHTIPVGAKFGVIVVVQDGVQIEVATYRADGNYSDGRRPDTVSYSIDAKEDVVRRDFTMNGLLCLGEADTTSATDYQNTTFGYSVPGNATRFTVGGKTFIIVDHVGGVADVQLGVIRAIGDPNKRFEEDALRMMRACRFAAQLGFEIETKTLEAIVLNARLLSVISRERIVMELFKMFSAPFPLKGIVPFFSTGLFRYALPSGFADRINLVVTLQRFGIFEANKDAMLGMAMFFADVEQYAVEGTPLHAKNITHRVEGLVDYLKLSNEQRNELVYMKYHVQRFQSHLSGEYTMTEAGIKRALREPGVALALEIMTQDEVIGKTSFGVEAVMTFVLKLKAYKPEEIKPKPLITGQDLIDAGIPAGPIFTEILFDVESHQLNGVWTTKEQAMTFVRERVYQDNSRQWVYMGLSTAEVRELE